MLIRENKLAKWAIIIVALFPITIAIISLLNFGGGSEVSADVIAENARKTVNSMRNAHMLITKTEYYDGNPSIVTKEEVWLKFPDKMLSVNEEVDPVSGKVKGIKTITKCNGKDLVVMNYNAGKKCSFAHLVRNIIRYPGGDFGGYPTFCTYQAPVDNLLLDKDNFKVIGKDRVAEKESIKIRMVKQGVKDNESEGVEKCRYLDPQSSIVLKEEVLVGDKLLKKMEIESVEMNVEIDEKIFEYDIPKDLSVESGTLYLSDGGYTVLKSTEELDARVSHGYLLPRYLPEGYELHEVGYVDNGKLLTNGRPEAANPVWTEPVFFTYSCSGGFIYIAEDALKEGEKGNAPGVVGLPPFALEEVELKGGTAYLYAAGDRSGTLYFEAGKLKVRITGSVDIDELKRVAESLMEAACRSSV